jgi:hypothetical protein
MNRRHLLAVAALAGGAVITDLAATLGSAPDSAYLRTGKVVGIGVTGVTVDIGSSQFVDMPALTQYQPILGDIVNIIQQGPVQLVLGRTAPIAGDNVLYNPSFELDLPLTSGATSWSFIADAAATDPVVAKTRTATGWGAVHGTQWLELSSGTTAGDAGVHCVSEAIPVTAGELWTAAAYVTAAGNGGNVATLRLAWYATDTAVYPATVVADTIIGSASFPNGTYPDWVLLRQLSGGGIPAPTGASFMRVVLSAEIFDVGYVYADAFIARKIK